jgi:hypothetical protein
VLQAGHWVIKLMVANCMQWLPLHQGHAHYVCGN